MEEEVNKETSFLGEVLDEEYCTFLEDTDGKKEELEKILYIQDSKKNEIIQSIYDSNTYDENKEIYQKVILKVQDIMDGNIPEFFS